MMKKLNNKKGFTLAELLVVVAIIAVLVAISIPVFTSQLEKAREAVDAANIRAEYAELMTEVLTGDTVGTHEVTLVQTVADWQNNEDKTSLEKIMTEDGSPKSKGKATLTYTASSDGSDGTVTVKYE